MTNKNWLLYYWYVRESKEGNSPDSLSAQEDAIRQFAETSWLNLHERVFEEKRSAFWKSKIGEEEIQKKRPQFDEMLKKFDLENEHAKKNNVPRQLWGIIFFDVSRMSRNQLDFQRIEQLIGSGYKIFSVSENIQDSAIWRYCFRMMQIESIFYSERQSTKSTRYLLYRLSRDACAATGSTPTYWYDVTVKKSDGESGRKVTILHPVNAEIVKFLYQRRYEDMKKWLPLMARKLHAEISERFSKRVAEYNATHVFRKNRKLENEDESEENSAWIEATIPSDEIIGKILRNDYQLKYDGFREITVDVNFEDDLVLFRWILDWCKHLRFLTSGNGKLIKGENILRFKTGLSIVPEKIYTKVLSDGEKRTHTRDTVEKSNIYKDYLVCACWCPLSGNSAKSGSYQYFFCRNSLWKWPIDEKTNKPIYPSCNRETTLNGKSLDSFLQTEVFSFMKFRMDTSNAEKYLRFAIKERLSSIEKDIEWAEKKIESIQVSITERNGWVYQSEGDATKDEEDEAKIRELSATLKDLENDLSLAESCIRKEETAFWDMLMEFEELGTPEKRFVIKTIFEPNGIVLDEIRTEENRYRSKSDRRPKSDNYSKQVVDLKLQPFFRELYLLNKYHDGIRV